MKIRLSNISLLMGLLMVIASQYAMAQNNSDYVFVENNAPEYLSLTEQYTGNPFLYFNKSDKPALYVFEQMLISRAVNNLHIYVKTQAGALLFPSGTITATNIDEHANHLRSWSTIVQGRIIFYSEDLFTGSEGALLKSKLQTYTGCKVEMSPSQQPFSF